MQKQNGRWQAVLFDLDGTLRESHPSANEVLLQQAVALGAQDSPERWKRALQWAHFYWADSLTLVRDQRRFRKWDAAFWTHYTRRQLIAFGCSPAEAAWMAPKVQTYMQEQYRPEDRFFPGVPEMLQALRERGYRLGVLSNRRKPFREYLEEARLAHYFDLILAAGEVGVWKPDRRIFDIAARRLRTPPQDIVYVGDNYFADILGAQQAGLFAVLVDPKEVFAEMPCPTVRVVTEVGRWVE